MRSRVPLVRSLVATVAAAFALAPALAACDASEEPYAIGQLTLATCPDLPEDLAGKVGCATIEVPQVHADPSGPKLSLRVFASMAAASTREPVVYLTGGPGASVGAFARGGMSRYYAATLNRPVVLIEQRGNALSTPALDCHLDSAPSLGEALRQCTASYRAQNLRLEAFNTIESAHDIEDLRRAIGSDKIMVWGVSYGALLAGAFAREHPQSIAALVLESSVLGDRPYRSFEQSYGVEEKMAAFMGWLTTTCAANTSCARRYPAFDYSAEVTRVLARIEEGEPVRITDALVIDSAETLGNMLFRAMYDVPRAMLFGRVLYAANRSRLAELANVRIGDEPALAYLERYLTDPWSSGSTNVVVNCYDVVNGWSEPGLAEIASRYREEDRADIFSEAAEWKSACAELPPPTVDQTRFQAPVGSDAPTLFVGGQLDPVTPVEWARSDAQRFPRSHVIESPCSSHGVLFGDLECSTTILGSFFDGAARAPTVVEPACVRAACEPETLTPQLFIETPR